MIPARIRTPVFVLLIDMLLCPFSGTDLFHRMKLRIFALNSYRATVHCSKHYIFWEKLPGTRFPQLVYCKGEARKNEAQDS